MDYDEYDAFLHHIFKQTQGDAWFRPQEESLSSGVCLRVDHGKFRVFPYENLNLEPFEVAVSALNPVVAVKVRSAAVHAALANIRPEDQSIYIDANTRIQVLDTLLHLPQADKEQCAAFIRDERVMIIWSDDLDKITPTCRDFEDRLIKLLWRSRTMSSRTTSFTDSMAGRGSLRDSNGTSNLLEPDALSRGSNDGTASAGQDVEKGEGDDLDKKKQGWFKRGRKSGKKASKGAQSEYRPIRLFAPVYNGLACALSLFFMGSGVSILIQEWVLDNDPIRFALAALVPVLFAVSLFFSTQVIYALACIFGPVAQYHENSKYYSAIPPVPNKEVDNNLPHVTIQMPVYKESLESVLTPSIESLKKAMQTYARQGGTSAIFINDDGLQLLPEGERDARIAFYANHGIGWVARPGHDESTPDGFRRAGRFKKASNMNYGLSLSLRAEKHLKELMSAAGGRFGADVQRRSAVSWVAIEEEEEDMEEKALQLAIDEVYEESGKKWKPWGANGKAIRMGEIVLLVDSDTVVPEDCLRDAARELVECPTVAIIQHESDVMQVAHHYFENGISYFTQRVNKSISMTCANGEVAPFVGHNAFLRWRAIQDTSFVDPTDGVEKIWSESNVSEDFDMALRLQMRGYIIRWATYSNGGFKEGVSLTVDDELNRWQKYAYGCSELMFNPLIQWWRKGPINHQIHRFLWSNAPLHYKISMMSYMFSYYGIAGSVTVGVINYVLLGFEFHIDGYYLRSFEVWLSTTVIFLGAGNVGFTLLEYRLGQKKLFKSIITNVMWIPFFFFFFGGLGIHLSQAILAHLFSYNMTWAATKKEVERSNFFKEVPKILKRFWVALFISTVIIAGMVVCSTTLVPLAWRVDSSAWAVIFPLAVSSGSHILFPIVLNPWLMIFSY